MTSSAGNAVKEGEATKLLLVDKGEPLAIASFVITWRII